MQIARARVKGIRSDVYNMKLNLRLKLTPVYAKIKRTLSALLVALPD